ncbi:ABC transporter ATP-binding protein [Kribbella sp. CA-293567]|uniref:ABC transporter ATP-binding protein n=1 Tax=Kribbella sp. CA-293567 TaxID=3002436 RepID=UPI0022DE6CDB|nr:ABC transporter ATP-binding protein [Kribbella sp. CA-293567]WBQ08644.1 ABC transporter ATP-binding protein [Kribbella sp. CA-293567]
MLTAIVRRAATLVVRAAAAVRLVFAIDPIRSGLVLSGAVLLGAVPVAIGWLTKALIDAITDSARLGVLVGIAVGLIAATAVSQLVPTLLNLAESELSRRVAAATKEKLFTKVNGFAGLGYFEQPAFHDKLRLALEAGEYAPTQILRTLTGTVQRVITLAGFLVALWLIHPLITLLAVLAAVPQLLVELRLSRERFSLQAELSPAERKQLFYSMLQTQAAAAKEIRLFGLGRYFRDLMMAELATTHRGQRRMDRRMAVARIGLDLVSVVPFAIALVWVARSVASGQLGAGDVVLFLAALAAVTAGTAELAVLVARFDELALTLGRFDELLALEPDLPVREGKTAPALRSGVELQDVWFRYREDLPWTLRGVSLRIPAGSSVAVVGPNGAGKSTLVKLLCRLYDPERGEIRWDGEDLRDLDPASLRNRIGSVFQDFVSYDLSARANIGLGDLPAMDDLERIRTAADQVGLGATLDALPRGFDTALTRMFLDEAPDDELPDGEADQAPGGSYLSGGQWQRLAIARMLMRADRDLLLLDEPSSGLDARAEYELHRVVSEVTQGRTRLLVSHRLNAVRDADLIVVVDQGEIVEQGNHHALIAADGLYAELFRLQSTGYADPSPAPGVSPQPADHQADHLVVSDRTEVP